MKPTPTRESVLDPLRATPRLMRATPVDGALCAGNSSRVMSFRGRGHRPQRPARRVTTRGLFPRSSPVDRVSPFVLCQNSPRRFP